MQIFFNNALFLTDIFCIYMYYIDCHSKKILIRKLEKITFTERNSRENSKNCLLKQNTKPTSFYS